MADGSIVFETKLDKTGVSTGLKEMKAEWNSVGKQMAEVRREITDIQKKLEKTPFDKKLSAQLASAKQRMSILDAKTLSLEEQIANMEPLEPLAREADQVTDKIDRLEERLTKMMSMKVDPSSSTFKGALYDLEKLQARLAELYGQMEQLDPHIVDDLKEQLSGVVSGQNTVIEGYTEKFNELAASQERAAGGAGMFANANKLLNRSMQNTGGTVANLGRSLFSLGNMFKLLAIRTAMRAVLRSASEGFANLAAYAGEASTALQSMKSSATYFSNSIAAALSPLLEMAAPIFSQFIDWVVAATNAFARFIAMLGGKATYTKAIKNNKALAKAAGEAGKAEEKALAAFDEINTLTDNSSSGGGGGAGGMSMFEEALTGDNPFRELLENGEWETLGRMIGDKINKAIESIDTYAIGEKLGKILNGVIQTVYFMLDEINFIRIGNKIADFLNGAIENIQFEYIGRLLVKKMTMMLDVGIGFLEAFHWDSFGLAISDGIMGALNEAADWVTGINWFEVGQSFANAIYNTLMSIDWAGILSAVFTLVGGVLGGLTGFIMGVLYQFTENLFLNHIFPALQQFSGQSAGELVMGLLNGIIEGLKGIKDWIKNNVFDPFMNAFRSAFGIYSPSKVMAEMGGYIMDGLINGISDKMNAFINKINEIVQNIKTRLTGVVNWISGTFVGGISGALNRIGDIFRGVGNKIVGIVESAINAAVSAINQFGVTVPSWVPYYGGQHFGFNVPYVSLPRLATGTVIPPRAGEFAAILGDNNRDTEVVSPLGTIKQAVTEVMAENNADSAAILDALNTLIQVVQDKQLVVGKRDVGEAAVEYINGETRRTGFTPLFE